MFETLINYGIFFLVVIILVAGAAIVRRSSLLTALFKFFGKSMFLLLHLIMLIIFTFLISMAAGIIIFIHPYFSSTPLFFTNGEPVHLLATQDRALLLFSLTYGVLYMLMFFVSSGILVKTRVSTFFTYLARMILFIFRYRAPVNKYNRKVVGTASHLITLCSVFILYPIVISVLFPELELTPKGNIALFICMLLFSLVPEPKYRGGQNETDY
ncbi:hypothetical protein DTX80_17895 [Bacilli bacterium]|uniref:hypothetical protein n=1 Tax=Oceanobacillus TaxID=182709 RepID=UPI000621A5E1|nr:hypothetical protein WH51_04725 [Bacilli bacterium VT-13-104]PZD81351.1 hypothetical protein DEJ64_17705 [Bacilli bacterium]PZD83066.1 hypothetical protein DEJ60_17800 [Bacilli bacterium]PZD84305.1 hypothetical protein DEJ66_17760 [Bacilli bacterium]RCO04272.1 hypothetical protein DTX80_17895 [Bacilli bacterium]